MTARTLRLIVVDDEQLAREELCFLLNEIGGVEIPELAIPERVTA